MIRFLLAHSILFLAQGLCTAGIVVTEFMAINEQTLADDAGEYDDWAELFNASDEPVDLAGFYVSNDPDDPTLWQIPQSELNETVLPPQGRLLLWLDKDTDQGLRHGPFRLSGEGGILSLSNADGLLIESITYPAQHPDIAYGKPTESSDTFHFLLSPTPGAINEPTGISQVGGVTFSKEAGLFQEPFELTMATVTEGSTIKYTTDGREPGLFAGKTFSEPLRIDQSTTIRAGVFVGNRRISPLQSQIYLAIDSDIAAFDSNLPVVLIDSRGHDFTKDTSLSTNFESSAVSSVFFDPQPNGRTSITGTPSHLGNAGMHVRGASSRAWPKKQYRFETWGDMQEDRSVSLLGMPADADWILAAPYFDRSLMRNHLTFRWWEALDYESPRTVFCELFLDMDGDEQFTMTDYQGVYVLTETIKRTDDRLDIGPLKPTEGGTSFEGSYAIEATNVNQHWVSQKGTRLKYVEPSDAQASPEAKTWIRDHFNELEAIVFSDDLSKAAQVIDEASHLDYDIMRELSRNIDGASTFLSFREGKVHMGPLWDYNQAYGLTSLFDPNPGWMTEGWNVEYMRQSAHWMKWWDQLENNSDYQTAWEDRWVALRDGVLSNERLLGDIRATAQLLAESAERNFDRWDILGKAIWVTGGGTRADPGEADRDTFAKEVDYMQGWLDARLAWIDSQVSAPPSFTPAGGAVPEGILLAIGQSAGFKPFGGTIHYTTDGTDPRLPGGALYEGALGYQEPFSLSRTMTISARARSIFGKWSALRQATFLVGVVPASAANLTISEIHYNPQGSDATEFIEIANRSDQAIDLTGVRLTDAVEFTFGRLALEPGHVVIVVEDVQAFPEGLPIAGAWAGRLANGGETIQIQAATGELILSVRYEDTEDWPSGADGEGYSLERVKLDSDLTQASAWQASNTLGGSPGVIASNLPITYTQWQEMHFQDPEQGQREQDPDHDGLANLIEYAFGGDPLAPTNLARMTLSTVGDVVKLNYPLAPNRSADIGIEVSPDLITWERIKPENTAFNDGQITSTWQRTPSSRYVRLRIAAE